ncbi:PqqD family peptide modification chaperone [Microbacterium sp. E-13]|uniref:PqqD family protein n=1 Tax=Microbacterium sp. E-13 TaxID=3404048 RepID=UPI003CF484C0
MPRNLTVAALGDVVRIDLSRLTDADAHAVEAAWRDAPASADAAVAPTGDPHPDDSPSVTALADVSREVMLSDLSQRVTLAAIRHARGRLWMLHAAGVALEDGRVVVLVGPSGRGKTTAARTLGRTYGYVSDETVAIAPGGSIHPYRKPLSVIERPDAPKIQLAPSELSLRPLPDVPLRLAAIVLLDRRPDAGDEPLVEPVDLGDALTEIVAQTSYLPSLPQPLRTLAAHVAAAGGIRRVIYREAESLVPLIPLLADAAVPGPAPREAATADRRTTAVRGPVYARTFADDAIDLDDPERIALLHVDGAGKGTVRVIAGVAPALWRAAGGASIEQLTDAAVEAHGHPASGDPRVAVAAAAAELVEAGVLSYADRPRWRISDAVAWVDSGDRAVVLDLEGGGGAPLALEDSAALIWFAVAEGAASGGGRTTDEVVAHVAAEAETDAVAVEPDVVAFLGELLTRGWIVPGT